MHKIKEMLHKDSEDTNLNNNNTNQWTQTSSNNNNNTTEHGKLGGLFHHGDKGEHYQSRELSEQQFEQGHLNHGERFEHGGQQQFHQHQQLHQGGDSNWNAGNERHIIHERETLKDGGDLYRSGVDPTMNRDIATSYTHDGGVSRERVSEGKIIKETVKEVELHKVQPVIHRNREQKEIRHVVEPHKQFEVKDTTIDHRERDINLGVRREASTLETSRDLGSGPNIQSSRTLLETDRQHQELPARVEEHVHRKVEEHVHPVIYKEVLKPKVTEETHHIYETVREAPIETYEVKNLGGQERGLSDNILRAEREFLNRESSRGIALGEGHQCSRDMNYSGGNQHQHQHLHRNSDGSEGFFQQGASLQREQPMLGHHQNIGGHHLGAGAVPQGHNSAYDAALCNQCTNNAICSHSTRDADRMHKMNEKKIANDDKLSQKQMRKAGKLSNKNASTVV